MESKRTPEMEQLVKDEMECEVLEDIMNELKQQGRWVEPGAVDKQIELALKMENQQYEPLPEEDMDDDVS